MHTNAITGDQYLKKLKLNVLHNNSRIGASWLVDIHKLILVVGPTAAAQLQVMCTILHQLQLLGSCFLHQLAAVEINAKFKMHVQFLQVCIRISLHKDTHHIYALLSADACTSEGKLPQHQAVCFPQTDLYIATKPYALVHVRIYHLLLADNVHIKTSTCSQCVLGLTCTSALQLCARKKTTTFCLFSQLLWYIWIELLHIYSMQPSYPLCYPYFSSNRNLIGTD